jgi:hypothetical protein
MTGLVTNAERSYRFDVRQFHRMMAAGIFDDQKVELVAGKIYAMTDLPPHTLAVGRLHESLRTALPPDEWTIREERPVLIGRAAQKRRELRRPADRGLRHDLPPRSRAKMAPVRRGEHSHRHDRSSQRPRHTHRGLDGTNGPAHRFSSRSTAASRIRLRWLI